MTDVFHRADDHGKLFITQLVGRYYFYLCDGLTGRAQVNELLKNVREHLQTIIFRHHLNQVLAIFVELLAADSDKRF